MKAAESGRGASRQTLTASNIDTQELSPKFSG